MDAKIKLMTWEDVENSCNTIDGKIHFKSSHISAVIGIMNGGIIPARIMSDRTLTHKVYPFEIKRYTLIGKTSTMWVGEPPREINDYVNGTVLVVDDICDEGTTMIEALRVLREGFKKITFLSAALVLKEKCPFEPDFFGSICKQDTWVVFPWETNEYQNEMALNKIALKEQNGKQN